MDVTSEMIEKKKKKRVGGSDCIVRVFRQVNTNCMFSIIRRLENVIDVRKFLNKKIH